MYFIVKTGYGKDDFIRIDNLADLERAQGAFLTNSKTIFDNGAACRGQDIISIREDWHREMGWNRTYRNDDGNVKEYELGEDDWNEIRNKGVEEKYKGVLAEVKARVQHLIDTGQHNLIGKNAYIKLPEKQKEGLAGLVMVNGIYLEPRNTLYRFPNQ